MLSRYRRMFDQKDDEKKDESLLTAASVIAAMAYQAAISPPGGIASVDAEAAAPRAEYYEDGLKPGKSLLVFFYKGLGNWFWINNTIALMASLSVIFLYVSGFSLKRQVQVWSIRMGMWITLSTMAVAYVCAVIATTKPIDDFDNIKGIARTLTIALIVWIVLVYITCFIQIFRFFNYVEKLKSADPDPDPAPARETEMI